MDYRKTTQFLMPAIKPPAEAGRYDIYPAFEVGQGLIGRGFESLAALLEGKPLIILDGYSGVFFDQIRNLLENCIKPPEGKEYIWIDTGRFLKPPGEIEKLVSPFLGNEDPLFGKRTDLVLSDFFNRESISYFRNNRKEGACYIIYGIGASLFSGEGFLVYFDLPKNELQYRSRGGSVTNLGVTSPDDPRKMYKRYYFVDWVVLNRHKESITGRISIIADTQRADDITWMQGSHWRQAMDDMSRSAFRARPWFEPGAWGGTWIMNNIPHLNKDVPNYAWSFELITPENGLLVMSSSVMLEFSFDFLMYHAAEQVLGDCHTRFGCEFPIRFDFLDTFDGGNLSVQCHPSEEYIMNEFGESFTQDETYYILDTKNNAGVWLGLIESASLPEFVNELEYSIRNNAPAAIGQYVQHHISEKHGLFVIPNGTVHGSGKNNMVLEISSTPYIFTFKMYDWLRPDLDGRPRTLNIERAGKNINSERRGEYVKDALISKPVPVEKGDDWQLTQLPVHESMFYSVCRYSFRTRIYALTKNKCLVMNLVEGESVEIITHNGRRHTVNYAETFILPAAAGSFTAVNLSDRTAMLVLAFVK